MNEVKSVEKKEKRAITRSPSYPGINLQEALSKAKIMYNNQRDHFSNVDVILRGWGFIGIKSAVGRIHIAALKKFGLIETEGAASTLQAKLTKLALSIIRDERPNSSERKKTIQEAALKPVAHFELWKEYNGNLPSDETIKFNLVHEKNYSERGADELIKEFRETIEFTGIDKNNDISLDDDNKNDGDEQDLFGENGEDIESPSNNPTKDINGKKMRTYSLPLLDDSIATLSAPFPMDELSWNQMIAMLNAMKPGIVRNTVEKKEKEEKQG